MKNNSIINYIKNKCQINKEILDNFLIYFNEQWLEYFNNGILELNDIILNLEQIIV